jgi:hypothetical protein
MLRSERRKAGEEVGFEVGEVVELAENPNPPTSGCQNSWCKTAFQCTVTYRTFVK